MQAPTQENKALMEGTIACYGTYTVEVSSLPNQIGVEQERTISSLAGELKVTNPTATVGGQINYRYRNSGLPEFRKH